MEPVVSMAIVLLAVQRLVRAVVSDITASAPRFEPILDVSTRIR